MSGQSEKRANDYSREVEDMTHLEVPQLKEKALSTVLSKNWEMPIRKRVKKFSVYFTSLILLKLVQVCIDQDLASTVAVANIVSNVSILSFWYIFILVASIRRRYCFSFSKVAGIFLNVYIIYLVICDDRHFFADSDSSVPNDVFIILTLAFYMQKLNYSKRFKFINFVCLFTFSTMFSAIRNLSSDTLILSVGLIFVFSLYNEMASSDASVRYSVPRDELNRQLSISEKPNMEKALKTCDYIQEILTKSFPSRTDKYLQKALSGLGKVRDQLINGPELDYIPENLDEEDRAYCLEHYTNIQTSSRFKSFKRNRRRTLIQVVPSSLNFSEENLQNLLSGVGRVWNFDTLMVKKALGSTLSRTAKFLIESWELERELKLDPETADNYFKDLESKYAANPYHNEAHASDVLSSILYFITHSCLVAELSLIESLCVLLASLGHDVGHPALNNKFLIVSRHKLAQKYNDRSVLENMHSCIVFSIMNNEERNILSCLSEEEYLNARKLIIEMILGTDMSKHFESFNSFSVKLKNNSLKLNDSEDRIFILTIALKCADIGHSAKSTEIHEAWSKLIYEEFYAQGDLEKANNMPVSLGFDRNNTNYAKGQIGFLKYICLPLYEKWAYYLSSEEVNQHCVNQLKDNISHWESTIFTRNKTYHFKFSPQLSIYEKQSSFRF